MDQWKAAAAVDNGSDRDRGSDSSARRWILQLRDEWLSSGEAETDGGMANTAEIRGEEWANIPSRG